jgi:hypothetical protein
MDLHAYFAIPETADIGFTQPDLQFVHDPLCERGIRTAGK